MKLVLDASVALSGLYTRAAAQEAMVAQHLLASIDNFGYACLPIGISKLPMACFVWNALDSWPRRRLRSSYGRWID